MANIFNDHIFEIFSQLKLFPDRSTFPQNIEGNSQTFLFPSNKT